MSSSPQSDHLNITKMSFPKETLIFDSVEDINLDALATPTTDAFHKLDCPCSGALDRATPPLSDIFCRSTSPSSDAAEPPARKEWPLLSFEKHVQHWLKSNDVIDIVGNEDKIVGLYQDYKKDYDLVKLILDTLFRFNVDNHEDAHQMAHGMLHNLSLGHTLLTLNPAWTKREEERTVATAAAETEEENKKVEEEQQKAEEERKKAEAEAKTRAKGADDLLAKVQTFTTKAKADAKSKTKDKFAASPGPIADSSVNPHNKAKAINKNTKTKSDGVTNDKEADKPAGPEENLNVKDKKFLPYIPKYLLNVHSRKYCMNDALVTRGSIGDFSIVSCLAASARKAHIRIVAHKSKRKRSATRVSLPERRGDKGLRNGWVFKRGKGGGAGAVAVTAEAVIGDLKEIEGSYSDRNDGLISKIVEGMMWM